MMQDAVDVTTVIFFGLAVFVIWRLRSVLGQKTGNERPPIQKSNNNAPKTASVNRDDGANIVQLVSHDKGPGHTETSALQDASSTTPGRGDSKQLQEIVQIDRSFDRQAFLDGATKAYEMVVIAFARGDRQTLKGLLSSEVEERFVSAIDSREQKRETAETTFVSMEGADITAIRINKKTARITVKFLANLINSVRDSDGHVIEGNSETVAKVTDSWIFERNVESRNPNWEIVATDVNK